MTLKCHVRRQDTLQLIKVKAYPGPWPLAPGPAFRFHHFQPSAVSRQQQAAGGSSNRQQAAAGNSRKQQKKFNKRRTSHI